mgnify:CR=1 FL=1|jgi:hypothetical protein
MEPWRIAILMFTVSFAVIGIPFLIVYISAKLSMPRVGVVKGGAIFLFSSILLSVLLPTLLSIAIAFVITAFAYKQQFLSGNDREVDQRDSNE